MQNKLPSLMNSHEYPMLCFNSYQFTTLVSSVLQAPLPAPDHLMYIQENIISPINILKDS